MISLLEPYLQSCPAFDWRAFNCCHFAAGWVKLCTGEDYMLGLPETATPLEAARLKIRLGGSLLAAVSARMGEPVGADEATLGDLVLVSAGDAELLGIHTGAGIVCLDQTGFLNLPESVATHAWKL